jgi:hypothetical protein
MIIRGSILLELSAEYVKIAKKRSAQMGLFANVKEEDSHA